MFEAIEKYDIKALVEDYTSVDLWVLYQGVAQHWTLDSFGEWMELGQERMDDEEFYKMLVSQSFVKIQIERS